MLTTKLPTNDYTEFQGFYQLKLPLELDMLIPSDDSVRLLSHILEEINYTKLYQAYSKKGRKPAVDPKTMFKVLTYAYMNRIYSTHAIETACRRDINFLWLLGGQKAPDHSTIARFRKTYLASAIDDLFYQQVKLLHHFGEIPFEHVFIDGTKIEANANRYTFVWKKTVGKNEARMFLKVRELVEDLNLKEVQSFTISQKTIHEDICAVLDYLKVKKENLNLEFVHGIGKRKSQIQKWTEVLLEFHERQKKYDKSNLLFNGRNSYSKIDTDATFMRMKEDHMLNGQLKPAYNVQIGVESEYIVGMGIFQDRNDIATLIPMLEEMKHQLGQKYRNIIADSGYESEENYLYLEKEKQTPYIKPQTYEKWKKRKFKQDISKRENMTYIPEGDIYICSNDRVLRQVGLTQRKSATGYRSKVTIYECEDCHDCPQKEKCTKTQGNRRMQVSKIFIEKRERSYQNIMTPKGVELRMNRSIQVEGAFGVLKSDYQFKRFLTRGKNSVKNRIYATMLWI